MSLNHFQYLLNDFRDFCADEKDGKNIYGVGVRMREVSC